MSNLKNSYRPLRNGKTEPYSLSYLLKEGLIGLPWQKMKVADIEFFNSGIIDVLLEYEGEHYYTIQAPEKLKHLIVENQVAVNDEIVFLYSLKPIKQFEVKRADQCTQY